MNFIEDTAIPQHPLPSQPPQSLPQMFDTFHQSPHGDFKPTFYNPFEVKHRRRTSRSQFKVLEKTFNENPKPNATIRRVLAQNLNMTPRGVQVWFQNRRAKAKLVKATEEKKAAQAIAATTSPSSPERLDRSPASNDSMTQITPVDSSHFSVDDAVSPGEMREPSPITLVPTHNSGLQETALFAYTANNDRYQYTATEDMLMTDRPNAGTLKQRQLQLHMQQNGQHNGNSWLSPSMSIAYNADLFNPLATPPAAIPPQLLYDFSDVNLVTSEDHLAHLSGINFARRNSCPAAPFFNHFVPATDDKCLSTIAEDGPVYNGVNIHQFLAVPQMKHRRFSEPNARYAGLQDGQVIISIDERSDSSLDCALGRL